MLFEVIENAKIISVYSEGEIFSYKNGEDKFYEIISVWKDTCEKALEMPAYGVSLNGETLKAIKRGVWLEFDFEKLIYYNEMPFERLLIEVVAEYSGFNVIRFTTQNGYDGRCFYLNLGDKNMTELYNVIKN